MAVLNKYIWLIVVVVYLIMPWDLFPGFLDDLVVLGAYILYVLRYLQKLKQARGTFRGAGDRKRTRGSQGGQDGERETVPTLSEAYQVLGLTPKASTEAVRQAYRARMAENHPDKVSHLSPELRAHANQLTLRINQAYLTIKQAGKLR